MVTEANNVRTYHNFRGFMQEEMSLSTGITSQTLGFIESGSYDSSLKICLALAKALDVALNDLFWIGSGDEKTGSRG